MGQPQWLLRFPKVFPPVRTKPNALAIAAQTSTVVLERRGHTHAKQQPAAKTSMYPEEGLRENNISGRSQHSTHET